MLRTTQSDWRKKALNIAEMRRMARRTLPRPIFDFADGAAEDEVTLKRNEADFNRWSFLPRPLNGAGKRDLSVEIFGQKLAMPVMIGPTGLAGLFHADGERAAARAAMRAGTGYCLSHGSTCTMEQLAETGISPRWMQVFVYRDAGFTRELVSRAQAANYNALVLTLDNQIIGQRERDLRNGFTIPPAFTPAQVLAMAGKAPWLWHMRRQLRQVTFANYQSLSGGGDLTKIAAKMGDLLDQGMNWADVDMIRKCWSGPLVLKGILHPQDALKALEHGVDGVIVSNHGGRQLDGAASAIEALPAISEALSGRMPVMIDGGIRRGGDVVKALALGASLCLVARPHLFALAIAGEAGVAHMLDFYKNSIDRVMGLNGFATVKDITAECLKDRLGG